MTSRTVYIAAVLLLAGCSGLTQMQDTISKFDQGAHSVATGQMAFFRQVQIADCNNQFYSAAFNFSIKQTEKLDLTGTCEPTILDNNQIKIRQALMDSLTLYVDKIQTLATGDSNKTLDTNSQNLAGQLNGLAKSHGFGSSLSIAQGVEAAVIAITEMALDQRKFNDLKSAASAMNPYFLKVIDSLKAENNNFAIGMASKMEQIEIPLHTAVAVARDNAVKACQDECDQSGKKNGSKSNSSECIQNCNYSGARSFLDVITAREVVRSINPLGASPVSVAEGNADPKLDPRNVAKQLNASLDALANANDALANAGTGGVIAAVNDLIARAQHANNILTAISK